MSSNWWPVARYIFLPHTLFLSIHWLLFRPEHPVIVHVVFLRSPAHPSCEGLCTYSENVDYIFTVFRFLTDFVCLYNYEFWHSLCKIVRSSVILLLPLLRSLFFKIATCCVFTELVNDTFNDFARMYLMVEIVWHAISADFIWHILING